MKLRIAIVQRDLVWEDRHANRDLFGEAVDEIGDAADIILLPEMFDTGFTMRASGMAGPAEGTALEWMLERSRQSNALLLASTIVEENGRYFNRLFWAEPSGTWYHYDKRHLFRMGKEHETFTPGKQRLVRNWKGWRICPLICYDLRFPVWCRNRLLKDSEEPEYDLLVFIANWPASRSSVWDVLLQARALENQTYVVGVNRTGVDGEGISYNGHSRLIDYKGNVVADLGGTAGTRIVEIDKAPLVEFRKKFPTYLDADSFRMDTE